MNVAFKHTMTKWTHKWTHGDEWHEIIIEYNYFALCAQPAPLPFSALSTRSAFVRFAAVGLSLCGSPYMSYCKAFCVVVVAFASLFNSLCLIGGSLTRRLTLNNDHWNECQCDWRKFVDFNFWKIGVGSPCLRTFFTDSWWHFEKYSHFLVINFQWNFNIELY